MFDGLIRRAKPGTAPGMLVGREPVPDEALTFTLTEYTQEGWEVYNEVEIAECSFHLTTPSRTWIDVAGHASAEMLRSLGQAFHLHALALEDVFLGNQRPKFDIYDKQGFIVLNDPAMVDDTLKSRQVSIFFGDNYVISFHDHKEDIFKPVRERIQHDGSRLRQFAIDYLVYALVDLVVDRKFPVLARISERLEELEDQSMETASRDTAQCIHTARRSLVGFHRIQWAERETVLALMRPDTPFIKPDTRTYLRDCLDHTVTVLELVESYRDMAGGLMELHLMETSNRMNEVMKALAIVTVFFMPLSFLAGVYGMNFERSAGNMPELGWQYGYLYFWATAVVITVGLFCVDEASQMAVTGYRLFGSELSPYSVKVRSYLRFKGIAHEWIPRGPKSASEFQKYAKLPLIPLLVTPEGEGLQDSTPIIEKLEAQIPEPSIHPDDPALRFLSELIEEYADEWCNKSMFHYRWSYAADAESASQRIAGQIAPEGSDDAAVARTAEGVRGRMIPRLSFVGSHAGTKDTIEGSLRRILDTLEMHFVGRKYLFGNRPALSDFGLWGQLYECWTDPTPKALIDELYPNTWRWIERMLQPKVEGDWDPWSSLKWGIGRLLDTEVCGLFLPWTTANAVALNDGQEQFTVMLEGRPFTQQTQKYHARSLAEIKRKYEAAKGAPGLDAILDETGCLRWLQD